MKGQEAEILGDVTVTRSHYAQKASAQSNVLWRKLSVEKAMIEYFYLEREL